MDRIFLDANILFSAAYRTDSRLLRLWELEGVELVTSHFAGEEAQRNLRTRTQRERLSRLLTGMRIVQEPEHFTLPRGVQLPEKDRPILLAAIDASATHLLTVVGMRKEWKASRASWRDLRQIRRTPYLPTPLGARIFSTSSVVLNPSIRGQITTSPPYDSTRSRPTTVSGV